MTTISTDDPIAVAVVTAIHAGDVATLKRLLADHPDLAAARLGDDDPDGMSRTLLHVAADWPGHYPNGAASITVLVRAGADVNARFRGPHTETPLHWAASSNDVDVLDALLDAGANIEASGAVIAGGTPLEHQLVELIPFPGGFVSQLNITFGLADERTITLPVAIVTRTTAGEITDHRIYVNESPLAKE